MSSQSSDDLEDLSNVGPATADKLEDAGFETYSSIAAASPSELDEQAGVGANAAEKIIRSAQEKADIGGFKTGEEIREQREEIGKITWGVESVDDILRGGVETQSITEVYGEFGAGKSQVTHQLAVTVQLPEEYGGLGRGAIFIDSEDTFRPSRIDDMVRGLSDGALEALMQEQGISGGVDDEEALERLTQSVLDNIHVAKAFNSNHQILMIEKAEEVMKETQGTEYPVGLVAVDSLTAHFRSEYVGRGELAERQQKLNKHLSDLKKLADEYNSAVVVTNQVASNPDSYFGDPTQPIGGNILGHASTYRLYLRKSKEDKRIVSLVDAPNLEDAEAVMRVTNEGLEDE